MTKTVAEIDTSTMRNIQHLMLPLTVPMPPSQRNVSPSKARTGHPSWTKLVHTPRLPRSTCSAKIRGCGTRRTWSERAVENRQAQQKHRVAEGGEASRMGARVRQECLNPQPYEENDLPITKLPHRTKYSYFPIWYVRFRVKYRKSN